MPSTTSTTTMLTTSTSTPTRRAPVPRPSCTHIRMDRIYGTTLSCSLCGRVPNLNFIYSCQVDEDPGFPRGIQPPNNSGLASVRTRSMSPPSRNVSKRRKLQKTFVREPVVQSLQDMINDMRGLGFHSSVIKSAETGDYTHTQILLLIAQKKKVKISIEEDLAADPEYQRSKKPLESGLLADKLLAAGAVQPSKGAESSGDESQGKKSKLPKATNSKVRPKPQFSAVEECHFKVCHACRPASIDRTYASFGSIIHDEVKLPPIHVPQVMPVQPVDIVKNIGLHFPTPLSDLTNDTIDAHSDAFESDIDTPCLSSRTSQYSTDSLPNPLGVIASNQPYSLDHAQAPPVEQMQRLSLEVGSDTATTDSKAKDHLARNGSKLAVKASTAGFRDALIKDLKDMLERADHNARSSPDGFDYRTGLTKDLTERLLGLYAKKHGKVFDADLWRELSCSMIVEAQNTPLPKESEEELRRSQLAFGSPTEGTGVTRPGSHADRGPIETFPAHAGSSGLNHDLNGDLATFTALHGPHDGRRMGEEGHVRGGIAVTEEGLRNHAPDLITAM